MQTIYMLKQDLETATAYQNAYKLIRDSLSSLNLTKELNQLQEELDVEKSNTEAALTKSKNIEAELRANLMEEENKRIQHEMEIMKLERESAELEKQAMENMMLLNKKIAEEEKATNQRNLAIAGNYCFFTGHPGYLFVGPGEATKKARTKSNENDGKKWKKSIN